MSRYIDADVLIDDLIHNRSFYPAIVASAIKNTPTADVVEVVRCKDCKYCENGMLVNGNKYFECHCRELLADDAESIAVLADDFCSYGERKEANDGT